MRARRILACLCGALAVTACGGPRVLDRTPFEPPVEVGLITDMSGSAAFSGWYQQHSLEIEIGRLNAAGGLLGHRVELVSADEAGDPGKAPALVKQLVDDEGADLLVGPGTTASYLAAKGTVAAGGVPQCLPASIADGALGGAPSTFRTQPSDTGSIDGLLGVLRHRRPAVRSVGLIAENGAGGHSYDTILSGAAARAGLSYAGGRFVSEPAADQEPQVQDLLGKGVGAIVLSGDPVIAAGTARAVDAAGQTGKMTLLGPATLGTSQYVDGAGPAATGTIFASSIQAYRTARPPSAWPASYQRFVRSVTARYGFSPQDSEMQGTPAAADCVVEWAAAVRKAGGFDRRRVARAWQTLDLAPSATVLGVRERFSASDHDAIDARAIFVYQWAARPNGHSLTQLAGP